MSIECSYRLSAVLKKTELMSNHISSTSFIIERLLDELEKKIPELKKEHQMRDLRDAAVSLRAYAAEYL